MYLISFRCFLLPTDEDECDLGQDNCHDQLASCNNTEGSFNCTCNVEGYFGDGVDCSGELFIIGDLTIY